MARKFLITSGLPYSNGRLHVGHIAGAYLPADTLTRYLRARGDDVRFVCGSDDNGVASLISARREGRTVQELTADYNAQQDRDFKALGIDFDLFGGTHQPEFAERHQELSQELFRKIHDNGYLKKKSSEQLYDAEADQFLPDRFVKGQCYNCGFEEAYGDQCEHCGITIDPLQLKNPVSTISGSTPVPKKTTHWYIQLQEFESQLKDWLESKKVPSDEGPAWRDSVLNFTLGQINQGLPERAMTRDLNWGIPVPLDDPDAEGKVLYVWFDAPIGYVSFTSILCEKLGEGAESYSDWWKNPDCKIIHFIGEDNTVFHALIWPAMLMAEGSFQLPAHVVANSFLNIKFPGKEEEKVSKSRGNAVWVEDYAKRFDPDPLRYYLTAIAPESSRTAFDLEDFAKRNNGELLNALGNFIHRSLTFATRNFDHQVPAVGTRDEVDLAQLEAIREQATQVTARMEAHQFKAALRELMVLARAANGYLDTKAPWKQRKTDLAACGTTLNVCIQTVKALATLMAPFLPHSSQKLAAMLNLDPAPNALGWSSATDELPEGHPLSDPEVLFRKIEAEELLDS